MLATLETKKAQEGDIVELSEDYPKGGFKRGQRGIVITEFDSPTEAYDLEMVDEQGDFLGFAYSVKPYQIKNLTNDIMKQGLEFLEKGDILSAKREFQILINMRASYIGTLHNMFMWNLADQGNWHAAIITLRILLEIDPTYDLARNNLAIAWLNYGVEKAKAGNTLEAFEYFYRASGVAATEEVQNLLKENFAATYYSLSLQERKNKQYDKALQLMRIACSYSSSDDVRKNLGLAYIYAAQDYIKNKNFKAAINAFEQAMEAGLISADILNDYAVALISDQRFDDAKRAFENALALSPDDTIIKQNLSRLINQEAMESFVVEEKNYDFVPIELVIQNAQIAITS